MELIKEFLKIANRDLKSSEILYEHHLYPQAMFYFSQSVEKANKALALTTGNYTEENMLDIRHDSTIIYKNGIIETKKKYERMSRNLNELPDLKNTTFVVNLDLQNQIKKCDATLREFAEIQNRKFELALMSKQEIVNRLEEIQSTEKEIEDALSDIRNFELTEQMLKELKDEIVTQFYNPNNTELTRQIEEELKNSDLTVQKMEYLIKEMYLGFVNFMSFSHSLYHLAVITLPHSVMTRYPQNEFYPTKIYTRKLAVVRNLPNLFQVQSKALKHLDEYCQEFVFV